MSEVREIIEEEDWRGILSLGFLVLSFTVTIVSTMISGVQGLVFSEAIFTYPRMTVLKWYFESKK